MPTPRMSQGDSACPALPAPTCPTTPAFTSCHQISTYDHSSYTTRYRVAAVQKSQPVRSGPCNSLGYTAGNSKLDRPAHELSSLKVCGDAVVDCSLQVPVLHHPSAPSVNIPTDLLPFSQLFAYWSAPTTIPAAAGPTWVAATPIPFDAGTLNGSLLQTTPYPGSVLVQQPGLYRFTYNLELQSATLNGSFVSVVLADAGGATVVDSRNFTFDPRFSLGTYALSGSLVLPVTAANSVFWLRLDNDNTGPIGVNSASLLVELLTSNIV